MGICCTFVQLSESVEAALYRIWYNRPVKMP